MNGSELDSNKYNPSYANQQKTQQSNFPSNLSETEEYMDNKLAKVDQSQRSNVMNIIDSFTTSSEEQKMLILSGILFRCTTKHLSFVSNCLKPLLKIDYITKLPKEVSLKILSFLDAKSLVQASSVSKSWKAIADDDSIWRCLCDQHINKKCTKCGWGLPLLLDDYLRRKQAELNASNLKRQREIDSQKNDSESLEAADKDNTVAVQRHKNSSGSATATKLNYDTGSSGNNDSSRFWKYIYRDRLCIERNWRRGKFLKKSTCAHPSGVHSLHSNQEMFATGTFSHAIDIYSTKTGKKMKSLVGHHAAIRDLFFDDIRLVSASMDNTVRVWCYRTGKCRRMIPAPGARCLHFEKDLLAVGLIDGTIDLWNFSNSTRQTLTGHSDTVTKVRIFKGQIVISCSDDGTARLWDLSTLECLRVFRGHTLPVTCFQFSIPNMFPIEELRAGTNHNLVPSSPHSEPSPPASTCDRPLLREGGTLSNILSTIIPDPTHSQLHLAPLLVTGSADNTIRVWSLQTGQCLRQSFGHLGEVTSLDMDSLRIISSSTDSTIKVWDLDSGKCMHTLTKGSSTHNPGDLGEAAMLSVNLSDTRILAGSGDGQVHMWDCSSDIHPACSLTSLLSPDNPEDGWIQHIH